MFHSTPWGPDQNQCYGLKKGLFQVNLNVFISLHSFSALLWTLDNDDIVEISSKILEPGPVGVGGVVYRHGHVRGDLFLPAWMLSADMGLTQAFSFRHKTTESTLDLDNTKT